MAEESKKFYETGGQILTFMAEGKFYAFEILSVTDIIEIPEITPIPKTPKQILGIMNHRGKAVPVMDFRRRLGMSEYEYDSRSCVIVIEINGMQYGILVDRVSDVESCTPQQIAQSPAESSIVSCFITTAKKRISLLNAEKLVRG
jgi:purine-binding chemotaxis protein CheW